MTNYMKKIMLSVALGLALVTPTLAQDAKCERGSFEEIMQQLKDVDAVVTQIPDSQLQNMFAKIGRPPNAKDNTHLTGQLGVKNDFAVVFIFEEGCFLNKAGPQPLQVILDMLGVVKVGE